MSRHARLQNAEVALSKLWQRCHSTSALPEGYRYLLRRVQGALQIARKNLVKTFMPQHRSQHNSLLPACDI